MVDTTGMRPREAYEAQLAADALAATDVELSNYTTGQAVDTLANLNTWQQPVVTYSFPVVDNDPTTPDEPADYIGNNRYGTLRSFSAEQADAARLAIELWDDLIPVDFVDAGTDPDADTRFFNSTLINTAGGAPAGPGTDGDIWIYNYDISPPDTRDWSVGRFYFGSWLLHEIGHTLGLSHAGPYPGANYNGLNYLQDSDVYTVMSYNGGGTAGATWTSTMGTPMVNDIAAMHFYYGADMTTRIGDTVYGFNSNIDDRLPLNFDEMLAQEGRIAPITIWDAGGRDTLDLSGFSEDAEIDLAEGGYSNAGGQTMAIGIAYGAMIENAIGGTGNDVIWGNDSDNVLRGGQGNDRLEGGAGNDTLYGNGGDPAGQTKHAAVVALALNQGVTDQYLEAAGYSGLSGASNAVQFSIEMLVDGLSGYTELLSYANGQSANAFGITLLDGGAIEITYRGSVSTTTVSSALLTDGETHRFSLTWDNKAYVIYVDGFEVGSGIHGSASSSLNGNGVLIFGQEQDSLGGGFQSSQLLRGAVTDIRIFDDIRTGSEIAANAFGPLTNPAAEAGLVSNWVASPSSVADGAVADLHGGQGLAIRGATDPDLHLVGAWDDDVLDGGLGDDIYHVDSASDVVIG